MPTGVYKREYHKYKGKRKCCGCKNILDFKDFYISTYKKDGYDYLCKKCRKQLRIENREEIKRYRTKLKIL